MCHDILCNVIQLLQKNIRFKYIVAREFFHLKNILKTLRSSMAKIKKSQNITQTEFLCLIKDFFEINEKGKKINKKN